MTVSLELYSSAICTVNRVYYRPQDQYINQAVIIIRRFETFSLRIQTEKTSEWPWSRVKTRLWLIFKSTWWSTLAKTILAIMAYWAKLGLWFLDHTWNLIWRIHWWGPYIGQIRRTDSNQRKKSDWSVSFFPFENLRKFPKNFKKVSQARVSNPRPFE